MHAVRQHLCMLL